MVLQRTRFGIDRRHWRRSDGGRGVGRYNGERGAQIFFTFTDAGEPGVADTAEIVIMDAGGDQVLFVSGDLMYGNHQAHSQ